MNQPIRIKAIRTKPISASASPPPAPPVRDVMAEWKTDAAQAEARLARQRKLGDNCTGSRGNDATNAALREKAESLIVDRRTRTQCDACYRPFLTSELRAVATGCRICASPACAEKAARWRLKP